MAAANVLAYALEPKAHTQTQTDDRHNPAAALGCSTEIGQRAGFGGTIRSSWGYSPCREGALASAAANGGLRARNRNRNPKWTGSRQAKCRGEFPSEADKERRTEDPGFEPRLQNLGMR